MSNFDTARKALDTSLNSSGSALKEHAKWSESLEARLNKLKSAWQSLSQTFMNSSFLKGGIDLIISFVNALDKLIDKLGTFGTIGFGASIFGLFKVKGTGLKTSIFGALSEFGTAVSSVMSSGDGLIKKFKGIGKAAGSAGGSIVKSFGGSLSAAVAGIGLLVAGIGLAINAYKNYKEEISEARQETTRTSDEFLDASKSFEQAYIKYSGKTNLTEEEEGLIRKEVEKYKVEGDLRRDVALNIKRLMEIGSYRGMRHRRGLPVRGQRTKTNARTRKGPAKTVANKKK